MSIGGAVLGTASRKYLNVLAGEAIYKGHPVTISDSSDDGVTVLCAEEDDIVLGVATATVASGQILKIQVKGIGSVDMFTWTPVAAGSLLVPYSDGFVSDVTPIEKEASWTDATADDAPITKPAGVHWPISVFAYTIADSFSTASFGNSPYEIPAGSYILTCPHSWWD